MAILGFASMDVKEEEGEEVPLSPRPPSSLFSGGEEKEEELPSAILAIHFPPRPARFCSEVRGVEGGVTALAVSKDRRFLAAATEDRNIWLWRTEQLSSLSAAPALLRQHENAVTSLAFDPTDSSVLASASLDGTAVIWSAEAKRLTRVLSGHTDAVHCLAWFPRGDWLATGSADTSVSVWDTESGLEVLRFTGHAESVRSLAFSPDGYLLASGSADYTIRLWDLEVGKEARCLHGHVDSVLSLSFGQEIAAAAPGFSISTGALGKVHLASSGGELDDAILVWDPETGAQLYRIDGARANGLSFMPDGRVLAAASRSGEIALWHAVTGLKVRSLVGHSGRGNGVCVSGDGVVYSFGEDGRIRVWNTAVESMNFCSVQADRSPIRTLTISPDCTYITAGNTEDTFRVSLEKPTGAAAFEETECNIGASLSMVSANDGTIIASLKEEQGLIVFLDPETFFEKKRWAGIGAMISCLALSRDNRWLAGGAMDCVVRVWDMITGQIRLIEGHEAFVRAADFAANASYFGTASDDRTVRVVDMRTWSVRVLRGHTSGISSLKFAPDGFLLASGGYDCTIRIWDARTGVAVHTLQEGSEVRCLAFYDDCHLFAGLGNGKINVWDAATARRKPQPEKQDGTVTCLCLSLDRQLLLSGGADGAISAWDPHALTQPQPLHCTIGRLYVEDVHDNPEEHLRPYPRVLGVLRECPGVALEEGAWPMTGHAVSSSSRENNSADNNHNNNNNSNNGTFAAPGRSKSVSDAGSSQPQQRHVAFRQRGASGRVRSNAVSAVCNMVAAAITMNSIAVLHALFVGSDDEGLLLSSGQGVPSGLGGLGSAGGEGMVESDRVCWALALASVSWTRVSVSAEGIVQRTLDLASPLLLATQRNNELGVDLVLGALRKAWYHFEHDQKRKSLRHPLDNLDADDLIAAMERFPAIANDFLMNCHLVPAYSFVQGDCLTGNLDAEDTWIRTSHERTPLDFWSDMQETDHISESKHGDKVERRSIATSDRALANWRSQQTLLKAYLVPLRSINNPKFLQACVDACDNANRSDLFASEAVEAILNHQWELYARLLYMRNFILYMVLVLTFSILVFYFDSMTKAGGLLFIIAWVLQGVKIVMWFIFLTFELNQIKQQGIAYVYNVWNIIDVCMDILILAGFVMELGSAPAKAINAVDGCAAVLLWFNVLFFLRAFEGTGPLVRTILLTTWELRYFMLLLMLVVTGFSVSFYALLQGDTTTTQIDAEYATFGASIRTTYGMMLGDFNSNQYVGAQLEVLLTIFWMVFMLIVAIVLLNLLIAIIGEGYTRVRENSNKEWLLEKARIVLEISVLLHIKRKHELQRLGPWLQVMRVAKAARGSAGARAVAASRDAGDAGGASDAAVVELRNYFEGRVEEVNASLQELTTLLKAQKGGR